MITFVGQAALAVEAGPTPVIKKESINKSVVLPVEFKEPLTAQSLALTPIFGPLNAATYVGTNRLQEKPDPKIMSKAYTHALINLGTIALGGVLFTSGASAGSPLMTLLGMFTMYWGPTIENVFFSSYYAKKAVEFNRKQYERFNWITPEFSYDKEKDIKIALSYKF